MEGGNPNPTYPPPPFYLSNPAKTRFVPSPSTPLSLDQQLTVFSKKISKELKDLPRQLRKEDGGTLASFLGDQGHHLEEALEDMKKVNALLKRGGGDDDDDGGTDSPTLNNLATSLRPLTWQPLEHFDPRQLRAFSLMPYMPLFPKAETPVKNLEEPLGPVGDVGDGEGKQDIDMGKKVKGKPPGKWPSKKCAVAGPRGRSHQPQRPQGQAGPAKGRGTVGVGHPVVRKGTAFGLGKVIVAAETGAGGKKASGGQAKKNSSKKSSGPGGGASAGSPPSSYEIESLEGLKLTIKLN